MPRLQSSRNDRNTDNDSRHSNIREQESVNDNVSQSRFHESLSIEETNKLRAKLGLKPLEIDSKPSDDKNNKEDGKFKDDWGEFYHKPADNIGDKKFSEKLQQKLHNRKEQRKFQKKLAKVKTLGEAKDTDDTLLWIERTKRIQKEKELVEKRTKMLDEDENEIENEQHNRDKLAKMTKYSEKDLKGLKIEHSQDAFKTGSITILQLKDRDVLDENAGDVLINPNIAQNEVYKKSNENKKFKVGLRPSYQITDEDPFDEFGKLKQKNILSKYDEEIGTSKKDSFVIGQNINNDTNTTVKPNTVSLSIPEFTVASDYYNDEEMAKFKKRKTSKKMKLKTNLIVEDDDDIQVNYDISTAIEEDNEAIDKALHKVRKAKQKETYSKMMMEVDQNLNEQKNSKVDTSNTITSSNIVLDATAEFCRTLGDIPTYGRSGNRAEEEELLNFEKAINESHKNSMSVDDIVQNNEMNRNELGWNSIGVEKDANNLNVNEVPILDEEPDVGSGVAAALKLAMSKGYLEKDIINRPSTSRFKHLEAKHYSIEDKAYGDEEKIFGNRRERYSGPLMDFKDKDIKPSFKLDYVDDEGKVLNAKEAFRYLSHKFHGKGPGKNKIEKRLRKKEQDRLMKKMSSTDTPLGTLNLLRHKQKEAKTPFVIISGSKQTSTT